MSALWLIFIYFSFIYPLVQLRLAGTRLLLFFIFLYIIITAYYHPFTRTESFVFLVSLYLTLFLLVYRSERLVSSGESIFNFYFRDKKSQPCHPLGNLARLPIELRRQIYFEILGGRVIHVVQRPRNDNPGRFSEVAEDLPHGQDVEELCQIFCDWLCDWVVDRCKSLFTSKATQDVANNDAPAYSLEGWTTVMRYERPEYCRFRNAGPLLLASRAVYSEAVDLLYRTNTFEFRLFNHFLGFSKSISRQDWHSIRSLSIKYESAWHPISFLMRHDDQTPLSQIVDIIHSMVGLQDLKMQFIHPWPVFGHLDKMSSISDAVRTEPKLLEHLSRIRLRSGHKWELTVNWPPHLEEKTFASFYITRRLDLGSSETT